jgi:hypothetical protein
LREAMPQSVQLIEARRDQMFPVLEPAEIGRLWRFGELKSYAAGERIVATGQIAPGAIVILAGRVDVVRWRSALRPVRCLRLQPRQHGGVVPGPSTADPAPRGCSAVAAAPRADQHEHTLGGRFHPGLQVDPIRPLTRLTDNI